MANCAVLTSRIHALQHNQNAVRAMGGKPPLQNGHPIHTVPDAGMRAFLVMPDPVIGFEVGEAKFATVRDFQTGWNTSFSRHVGSPPVHPKPDRQA